MLDVLVAALLIRLLGFHWALLPTLAAEAVPALDLAPNWTAAVLLITGGTRRRWWIIAGWILAAAAVALIVYWTSHEL